MFETQRDLSYRFIALMATLTALNALAIDIMLPALFNIGVAFEVSSKNDQQLIIVAYVIGLGGAQLFIGPLADRFGRKTPLIVSLIGYTLLALLCSLAPDFQSLVLFRGLQGACAAGARVISMSTVRDTAKGDKMAQIMSLIMVVFMAVPILAPSVGWAILLVGDWRSVFIALAGFGVLVTLWTMKSLPETLPKEKRQPLALSHVLSAYLSVFKTRTSAIYTIALGMLFGAFFTYISTSEQIFRDVYGVTDSFPIYFAFIALFMAFSSATNAKLVRTLGARRVSHGALLSLVVVSSLFFTLHTFVHAHVFLFVAVMCIVFFLFGMVGANFNALAIEPLGHIAGVASAAIGFTSTALSGTIGGAVGRLFDGTLWALSFGFCVFAWAAIVLIALGERGLFRAPATSEMKAK